MVLCRPFLIELEFGNVAFEEMKNGSTKKKKQQQQQGSMEWSAPNLKLPLAAYGLSSASTKAQPPLNRAWGWEWLGDLASHHYFQKDR